ncbi:glycosyltransferase family 1 protein [Microbacterium lushaniae]|nr:glycosyltransferase family 1 protein [Microbacterium lushaniae]
MMRRTPLVWSAGVAWNETAGTDRRIVEEIARLRAVWWIDPPQPLGRPAAPADGVETEVPGVLRLGVTAPPALTRWPMRLATDALRGRALARAVRRSGASAVVVANPLARFPGAGGVGRVLYVTDDWVAGAPLMQLPRGAITRGLRRNRREADIVAVVSPALALAAADVVLPNGTAAMDATVQGTRQPIAGIVGQLNERLDLDLLEALPGAGIRVRVVGPRADRDPSFGERLDGFLAHPLVDWRGRVPAAAVAGHLAEISVGLTPYADTDFNRASSPLKTFEYLAAGVPVVSSDLPASRWLDTPHVAVTRTPDEFLGAVRGFVGRGADEAGDAARRAFVASHTWQRRAEDFLDLVDRAEARATVRVGGAR